MATEVKFYEPASLIDRLNGFYRIPIRDGLGPAGGEEPQNPNEFVRTFGGASTPIMREAAKRIAELEAGLLLAGDALARYEVAHDQDKGSWSLEGLHTAEEVACLAALKIDALLPKSEAP